ARPMIFECRRRGSLHRGSARFRVPKAAPRPSLRYERPRSILLDTGPYSIELLAKDVIALLDAQGLDRAYFCGLSMGGMIGMWLGINAPERLNKLVLCNTGARIGTRETWDTRIETVRKNGMKSVASAVVERWFTPAFRQKSPATISSTLKM